MMKKFLMAAAVGANRHGQRRNGQDLEGSGQFEVRRLGPPLYD